MIRRQMDLASVEISIKSIMAVLFRLDKKLPIIALGYIFGMAMFALTPADNFAVGKVLFTFAPFVHNTLRIPEYASLYLLFSISLVSFGVGFRKAGRAGVLFCVAFAVGLEVLQARMPAREFSVVALGLNFAGIFLGYVAIQYYLHATFVGRWE